MDKKTKMMLVVVVVAVVVVGTLLFFVVFKDDENKFFGTWEQIESIPSTLVDPENHSLFETYYVNNSLKFEIVNKSTEKILDTSWWIFKVEFGKLYIGPDENRFGTPLSYSFSDVDTKLTLTRQSDPDEYWVYSKIS